MKFFIFLFLIFINMPANAQIKEFEHLFDVPKDEKIPNLRTLEKQYFTENSNYNWKYDFSYMIAPGFDKDFLKNIKYFGSVEKRINNEFEERIYRQIKRIPKAFYPYIGPELHNVPGLSGKILDMPGIKETKNQFPKRVASVFKDIPNLEFVSPTLYIYLMPEIWGEGIDTSEFPKKAFKIHAPTPTQPLKSDNVKKALALVSPDDYSVNRKPKDKGFRHYQIDNDTPLSSADVEAFVGTLDKVLEFGSAHKTKLMFIRMSFMTSYWDEKNSNTNQQVSLYRNMVNPCQSAIRKLKWAGKLSEFQDAIGQSGFDTDEWAKTCDKTIKAYRLTNLPTAYSSTIQMARSGVFYDLINRDAYYTPEERLKHKYFIEAFIQTFDAPYANIRATRPYKNELKKKLRLFNGDFLGSPLILP